ncbi:MAG: methylcrotonoyl-CoA carboxylase [Myxococcales bacterium]|nr:methylcrotonoyl-CoA carboxylase [Myxococcales bacterium]
MRRIRSQIDTRGEAFRRYRAHNRQLVAEFRRRQEEARHERPERDMKRLERLGKLFIRDRIEKLIDPGTPFLELSSLAANSEYDGEAKGASSITGIGIVSGREVIIRADDPSIKGGAWYPLTIKKIVRCLEIAIENRLPVIHLCDSAGGFLPLQAELFPDKYLAGRIFRNQSILSKMGCKQLSLVFGHCTAGGAYIPSLSDYAVILRGNGGIFLGGPPLVKAATGEIVDADTLGGADVHTQISGTADYAANSEEEAILLGREIVSQWTRPAKTEIEWREPEEPFYAPEELYGIIPDDIKVQFDMREVIARIVDGSYFHEYQPDYGTTLVTGYAHIWGYKVGVLANNGVLFNDSSLKAAHFMELCNQNRTPLLFLQNITGFMVGQEYEARGICKDGAKMIMVQSCSEVPKFTVMVNGSFGAGNYGMCGRAYDGRFIFSWPNHQIGIMGAEQAANTLADVKIRQLEREGRTLSPEEIAAIREPVIEAFARESSAYYATSHLWDDGIIDPADTRNALGIAISASLNAPIEEPRYGILRL